MDLKTFTDEINLLNKQHEIHIDSGAKPSDFSDGYEQKIESLIHQSVSSDEWPNIIKHIAFLIYAGSIFEIATKKTTHVANRASEVANIAAKGKEEAEKREMMARMEGIVANERAHRLAADLKSAPSRAAKKAVSNRADQKLKQPFKDYCNLLIAENKHHAIKTIHDLLSTSGCDISFKKTVDERTLKEWAKECGFTFRAGRPAKN